MWGYAYPLKLRLRRVHCVPKVVINSSCYNFETREPILVTYERNAFENVTNRKKLYFPIVIAGQIALVVKA